MISRRGFNRLLLAGAVEAGLLTSTTQAVAAVSRARVVIIGGGFGGATVARYLRLGDPSVRVTLVEPKQVFYTCPLSNSVIGGLKNLRAIAQTYTELADRYGVRVIHDQATAVEPVQKTIRLAGGDVLAYDRLVMAPGVDFIWEAIEGYSERVARSSMPHAYDAGAQTALLRRQLVALQDGQNVIIVAPKNPFRCPAAPYERASLIANDLKYEKPKSKIIILDEKDVFTKQDLFMLGWDRLYPGLIEWRSGSFGGKVERVNAARMTVATEFGDEKGGVINVIPPQKAGRIAFEAGLVDAAGWCPIDPISFESRKQPGIHVIGDAAMMSPMPKSGMAANTQGKWLASWLVSAFGGQPAKPAGLSSLCFSLIGPDYAVSVAVGYDQTQTGLRERPDTVRLTSKAATTRELAAEAVQSEQWYQAITRDIWY